MESAIPISGFFSQANKLKPAVKTLENEDQILARLSQYPEWETLRTVIERWIEDAAAINKIEAIKATNLEEYGLATLTSNITINAYQDVIDTVQQRAAAKREQVSPDTDSDD